MPTATGWFTKLRRDGRYVDVEDVDVAVLSQAADALDGQQAPPGWATKVAIGLRDAVAVVGHDELATWQHRLAYRDAAAAAEVAARLPLLAPSALYELTYARGDLLSFAARLSAVLLDVVAVLGAVNRQVHPGRRAEVAALAPRPADAGAGRSPRPHPDRALTAPSPVTMGALDVAVLETLDLVDRYVPGADTRAARYAIDLRPRPAR